MKRLLLSGLLAVTAHAVDVSGTYENVGTVVGASAAKDNHASFHGLLGLEFDLPLALARFSQTEKVTIQQTDSAFRLRCLDADGNETWIARWNRDAGYGLEDELVKLVFSKYKENDGYLFLLRPAGEGKFLVVEVHRIQTTPFGPVGNPIGTFLFSRVAGKARISE